MKTLEDKLIKVNINFKSYLFQINIWKDIATNLYMHKK